MSEQTKCPFTGAGTPPKYPTGRGTSNKDWWPNGLNLKILSQHSSMVNPMDKKFNYAKEFKKLNFNALKKDLHKLNKMTDVETRREVVDALCKYWEAELEQNGMVYGKEYSDLFKTMRASKKEFRNVISKISNQSLTKSKKVCRCFLFPNSPLP